MLELNFPEDQMVLNCSFIGIQSQGCFMHDTAL